MAKIKDYPAYNEKWEQINKYQIGIRVEYPDTLVQGKKYPVMVFAPGMGNLSAGTVEDLKNLTDGYDYDGPTGPAGRVDAAVHPDFIKMVDTKQYILVVIAYKTALTPEQFGWIYDTVRKDFTTADRWAADGFSWGSGHMAKIARDPVHGKKILCLCPTAPTDEGGDWANAVNNGVLMHLFVNAGDDNAHTNLATTQRMVNGYNAKNPPVKANYTAFNKGGHGGTESADTEAPPVAPGGQGVVNLAENKIDWYIGCLQTPRMMKTGVLTTPPVVVPPVTGPAVEFYPPDGTLITATSATLDATGSTGLSANTFYFWEINPLDGNYKGFTAKIEPNGKAKATLSGLKDGKYVVKLTAGGKVVFSVFTVKLASTPPVEQPKVPAQFNLTTKVLTFTDGTAEGVKTATITTESGKTYNV